MARRRVCENCGYLNDIDNDLCDNCNFDLSLSHEINVPKGEKKQFYDEKQKIFIEKSSRVLDTESIAKRSTTTIETKKEIVYCPSCGHDLNDEFKECPYCGCLITSTKVIEPEFKDKNLFIEDEEENEEKYSLSIGVNGENVVPVNFKNERFIIGRKYINCLNNKMTVSGMHCYIKKVNDKYVLFESKNSPSTNGTYIRTIGDRKTRIEPGKGVEIKNGSLFYIADVPVVFRKDL